MKHTTLLVAIMYTTILSISMGFLLSTVAMLVKRGVQFKQDGLYISWLSLFLLVHFSLFWQTAVLMEVEEWVFSSFLYLVIGPILLFIASNLLVTGVGEFDAGELNQHFRDISRQFFVFMALLAVWLVSIGAELGRENSTVWYADMGLAALALILVFRRTTLFDTLGVIVAWLLVVVPWMLLPS